RLREGRGRGGADLQRRGCGGRSPFPAPRHGRADARRGARRGRDAGPAVPAFRHPRPDSLDRAATGGAHRGGAGRGRRGHRAGCRTPRTGRVVTGRAAPPRSWLYVPGTRPELASKAANSGADAIVVDLEDAVPEKSKVDAREAAARLAQQRFPVPLYVRINPLDDGGRDDLRALAGAGSAFAGVRLPKSADPAEVAELASDLTAFARTATVHLIVETALGVERVSDL